MDLDIVIDKLLTAIEEAKQNKYSDFILRCDLKKILSKLLDSQREDIRTNLSLLQKNLVRTVGSAMESALEEAIAMV